MFALGGGDNVGKTTHARWLAASYSHLTVLGGVHHFHPAWSQLPQPVSDWWFRGATTEEHVELMSASAINRAREAENRDGVVLLDRGWHTMTAACAATACVKEGLTPTDGLARVRALLPSPPREQEILLRVGDSPSEAADVALTREGNASPVYRAYQRALAEILSILARSNVFAFVIDCGISPILAVQNTVREALNQLSDTSAQFRPTGASLQRLWVIGGLSESGKSTLGEHLRRWQHACRLKMAYLMALGAALEGIPDPYDLDGPRQAELLTRQLLRFADAHTDQTVIAIESAHRPEVVSGLRAIFGERCCCVYLDAPPELRRRRSRVPELEFEHNERTKIRRRADAVRSVADLVVDNSGSALSLRATVDANRLTTAATIQPIKVERLGLPANLVDFLSRLTDAVAASERVSVIALTGSAAASAWVPNWSDVDLLVIAEQDGMDVVFDAVNEMSATLPDTRIAVTAFTPAETWAGWVPPRVLHALRLLGAGRGAPLYARGILTLPLFTPAEDAALGLRDLPTVAFQLRRLLKQIAVQPSAMRELYRHLVLFGKLILRLDGIHAETAAEVIARLPEIAGLENVAIPELVSARDDAPGSTDEVATAAQTALTWYADQFARLEGRP